MTTGEVADEEGGEMTLRGLGWPIEISTAASILKEASKKGS